jgi:hypothetical protein
MVLGIAQYKGSIRLVENSNTKIGLVQAELQGSQKPRVVVALPALVAYKDRDMEIFGIDMHTIHHPLPTTKQNVPDACHVSNVLHAINLYHAHESDEYRHANAHGARDDHHRDAHDDPHQRKRMFLIK